MVDISSFNKLYNKTAQEYVTLLEKKLLEFLKNKNTKQALSDLHRSAHSLKSESLVMGHPHTATLAKMLEDIFDAFLNKRIHLTEELKLALIAAVQELKNLIHTIQNEGKETATPQILADLSKLTGIKPATF